jgi:hypothetical protein
LRPIRLWSPHVIAVFAGDGGQERAGGGCSLSLLDRGGFR